MRSPEPGYPGNNTLRGITGLAVRRSRPGGLESAGSRQQKNYLTAAASPDKVNKVAKLKCGDAALDLQGFVHALHDFVGNMF